MLAAELQTVHRLVQPRKMSLMLAVRHRMRVNAAGGLELNSWFSPIAQIVASLCCGWQPLIDAINGGGDGTRTASIGEAQVTPPFGLIKINAGGHRNTCLMQHTTGKITGIVANGTYINVQIKSTVRRCVLA